MANITTRVIPIMAIPGVVFFPETSISLYIYEEFNKKLIKDAVEKEQDVGIFLARPLKDKRDTLLPSESVGTSGKIISHIVNSGGFYNVTLRGKYRATLKHLIRIEPYPTALVELGEEEVDLPDDIEFENVLQDIISLVLKFDSKGGTAGFVLPPKDMSRGLFRVLINSLASLLPVDPSRKQSWLYAKSIYSRYIFVKAELERLRILNQIIRFTPPPTQDPWLN